MGAADSKLQFKNHIFRLLEVSDIPADDAYWAQVRYLWFNFVDFSI